MVKSRHEKPPQRVHRPGAWHIEWRFDMHPNTILKAKKRTKPGTCEFCGKQFMGFLSSQARFCSKSCSARRGQLLPIIERFRLMITRSTVRDGTHLLWKGSRGEDGYGRFERKPAHRFAWQLATGCQVPDGLIILHTCDIKNCMQTDDFGIYIVGGKVLPRVGHLALGTTKDNAVDASEKGHSSAGAFLRALLKPESFRRGGGHHNAALTDVQAEEIRAKYRSGAIIKRDLAAAYGVSEATIKALLSGRTYRIA